MLFILFKVLYFLLVLYSYVIKILYKFMIVVINKIDLVLRVLIVAWKYYFLIKFFEFKIVFFSLNFLEVVYVKGGEF